jgi:hypothetical protein
MNYELRSEIGRLTQNAAIHREDLLWSALRKSRWRKVLSIAAGVLSLTSGGAITLVLTRAFGAKGVEIIAAMVAFLSGATTLAITAYFTDEETLTMLNGSSKYLALRESVYRLVVDPSISDEGRFTELSLLQKEYARLDESYSRFFSVNYRAKTSSPPPPLWFRRQAMSAVDHDMSELDRRIGDRF